MNTWTFGVEPLAQTITAADLLRRVTNLVLAAEGEEPEIERLITELERAEAALLERVPSARGPRIGDGHDRNGRVYLDHGRDIGAFNPCVPVYRLTAAGPHAEGMVRFPVAYEGPPGIVHGGFLALFFDCAVQHHNCEVGVAGKTTSMAIRYRRPAPLLEPLAFMIERDDDDSRIRSSCRLRLDEVVLCEVEVESIAGDRAALPTVDPRRSRQ